MHSNVFAVGFIIAITYKSIPQALKSFQDAFTIYDDKEHNPQVYNIPQGT